MRSTSWSSVLLVAPLASLALACGGGNSGDDDGAIDAAVGAVDAAVDAPIPPGYTRLVGRTWALAAGQADTYKCVRVTIPQDMYVTGFMAQAPRGTHHTVLSVRDAQPSGTGEYDCSANALDMNMLYASGVGTDVLDLPAGVGLQLKAGQQVNLNLHLFNASDQAISGDSAILVKSQATPPPMLAEMMFAGSFNINVPPGATRTINGGCTIPAGVNQQMFALWPHMHQYATHQKVELIRGGSSTVLLDTPFAFEDQKYYPQSPVVTIRGGDRLAVACTYTNTSNTTLTFGDSSTKEMCFAGVYVYPARGAQIFECAGL
jgi:Copper type II ascorbate-dependent monooxygenase, C-terminal domain